MPVSNGFDMSELQPPTSFSQVVYLSRLPDFMQCPPDSHGLDAADALACTGSSDGGNQSCRCLSAMALTQMIHCPSHLSAKSYILSRLPDFMQCPPDSHGLDPADAHGFDTNDS